MSSHSIHEENKASFEEKDITGFSYNISTDKTINTKSLLCHNSSDNFIYALVASTSDVKVEATKLKEELKDYMYQDGYFSDIFNAELVNEDWLIYMFLFKNIYHTTKSQDMNSFHFNKSSDDYPLAGLSAIHHFLHHHGYNDVSNWNWLSALDPINKKMRNKYRDNFISLSEPNLPTVNNISIINNNIIDRGIKLDFITNDILYDSYISYIIYACTGIKTLDNDGLFLTRFPSPNDWNTQYINILWLYALLFQEIYIYNFDITEPQTYILCKCKKVSSTKIYKALIYLCLRNGRMLQTHNLFTKNSINNEWMKQISIICNDAKSGNLATIDNMELVNFVIDNLRTTMTTFS